MSFLRSVSVLEEARYWVSKNCVCPCNAEESRSAQRISCIRTLVCSRLHSTQHSTTHGCSYTNAWCSWQSKHSKQVLQHLLYNVPQGCGPPVGRTWSSSCHPAEEEAYSSVTSGAAGVSTRASFTAGASLLLMLLSDSLGASLRT